MVICGPFQSQYCGIESYRGSMNLAMHIKKIGIEGPLLLSIVKVVLLLSRSSKFSYEFQKKLILTTFVTILFHEKMSISEN